MSITTKIDGLNADLKFTGIATEIDGLNLNLITETGRFSIDSANIVNGNLVFNFTDSAETLPDGYVVYLYTDAEYSNLLVERTTETQSVTFTGVTAGTYYCEIVAGTKAIVDPAPQPTTGLDSEEGDIAGLEALYNSTNGGNWDNNTNWSASGMSLDPAPYGVTVESIGGENRVTSIDLRSNSLSGILPNEIGNFRQIFYWNVKHNQLTGGIPQSIENWVNIIDEYWSYRLADDVNKDFPNLDLHNGYEDYSTNFFDGVYPDVWANRTNLEVFQLHGSYCTTIFYESMSACVNLGWIFCAWSYELNQQLPTALFNLPKLYQMKINRSNGLQGPLPTTVDLPELRIYGVDRHRTLTGPLPDLTGSKKLQHYAARNRHTDEFPSYLFDGSFPLFRTLYLAWNGSDGTTGITGQLPDLTASANNISILVLDLVGNKMDGPIPDSLALHQGLIITDLRYNNFTGEIPQNGWSNHTQTRFLAFAGDTGFYVGPNNFSAGPAPQEVPNSPDLQYLYYSDCNFTSAPAVYGNIPQTSSLKTIFLGGNKLTFESMVPIANGSTGSNVDFGSQNPFGTGDVIDVGIGSDYTYREFDEPLDSTGVRLSLATNSYQWQKSVSGSWMDVAGKTSQVLGFVGFASSDEGVYRLKVTNPEMPSRTIYSATVTLNATTI
jgi:hypothetical protein